MAVGVETNVRRLGVCKFLGSSFVKQAGMGFFYLLGWQGRSFAKFWGVSDAALRDFLSVTFLVTVAQQWSLVQ